jgi:K+/H+ antiporter YhaU regulatory subunit KhtT
MDEVLSSLRIHMLTIEPGSQAEGKTLGDLGLAVRYGIADCGLRRDRDTRISAGAATRLQAGDALILFCSDKIAGENAVQSCRVPE